MSKLKPCRHLDYDESKYTGCVLKTCAPHFPDVKYFERGPIWGPKNVQFCGQGRGRINALFDCYNGSMPCYDPAPETPSGAPEESCE